MISIARSSFKPLYLQISDSIREEIETGKIMPGQKIWSERELMQELNVSRNTAQQAIEELVRNGFVSRVQGKGTFAIERKVSYGLQRMSSFSEEMRRKGMQPSSRVISMRQEHPSQSLAQRLRLSADSWVFRLERLRLADGLPMAYHVSHVPMTLCPGIEKFDFTNDSLFSILENQYNLILSWQKQAIRPVIARKEEADLLDIMVGMPLLLADGVAFLEDGTPFESNRILYRSDLYEFTVQSSRKFETWA